MKRIDISTRANPNNFTLVSDEDYDFLNQWHWWANAGGYVTRQVRVGPRKENKRKCFFMHREVAGTPSGLETDHINGDTLDNRRCNLRNVTQSQNQYNRHRVSGEYKYKGVSFCQNTPKKRRILARITYNKKSMHLGYFDTEIEAAKEYDKWALLLRGCYAHTNF